MPDFDSFERLFKSVMAADLSSEEGALKIARLPDVNKVGLVKGKPVDDLIAFLDRARASLLSFFPNGSQFTSTENNREGKDLFELKSRTHVELKSGQKMTDANSGLGTVAWALDDREGKLNSIMKSGQAERRALILRGKSGAQIEASKSKTMDDLAEFFSSKLSLGPAPARLTHYFKSVAVGVTKEGEIRGTFGSEKSTEIPLLLEADWDAGLSLYEKAFLPAEEVQIVNLGRTGDRAQIVGQGAKTGRQARLYPNFKNSWKAPNGVKYEASNWVKTPCFHVWIS